MTPKVLVASTVAAHCCDGMTEFRWLTHAAKWQERGYDFFLAAQVGQGHDPKVSYLAYEGVDWPEGRYTVWKYSLDMGEPAVTSDTRLPGICMGRNMAHEFAVRGGYTHLMFIDTDVLPTEDGVERLLEIDHPIVGAHVPSYCHNGPRLVAEPHEMRDGLTTPPTTLYLVVSGPEDIEHPVTHEVTHFPRRAERWADEELGLSQAWFRKPPFPEGADVRVHWTTAGALLLNRDCFRAVRWRTDPEAGLSDDPATIFTAERLGFGREWVRHDVVWDHEPLVALEHRGRDLSVRR